MRKNPLIPLDKRGKPIREKIADERNVTNEEIAGMFTEIAEMLRAKKENIFKIRAYEKIAKSILALKEPVETYVKENRLKEIAGAGEAIQKKLTELTVTGKLMFYEKLKSEFPGRETA